MDEAKAQAVARFRLALELFELGEAIMRQNIKRRDPQASEREIEARLLTWVRERPGAPHGDAVGRVVSWPRRTP